MSTDPKPVAKSLHTITVLQRLGEHFIASSGCSAAAALNFTFAVLDLQGKPDPHGLRYRALALLTAGDA